VGELWLGGEGLARGYLGRPELTAERFRPDPFAGSGLGSRLYRTGDLARWGAGGELAFLGRLDHQVKLRGHRIELGEVESALAAHPAVGAVAVVVREDLAAGPGLVAYVAPTAGPAVEPAPGIAVEPAALRSLQSLQSLRSWLLERLPRYMVPAVFVQLAALPRLASGKVDRRALPPPMPSGAAGATGAAGEAGAPESALQLPRDPLEEAVCALWRDLLGREQVGIHEDFFALGGHSLLAARLTGMLGRTLGVELPLRQLFETPTVAGLAAAAHAARRGGRAAPVPPVLRAARPAQPEPLAHPPPAARYPLSFAQEREWLLDQLEPGTPAYNVAQAVRLRGRLDVRALRTAFDEIAGRHEALRTTFPAAGGQPVQLIAPALELRHPVVDLAALPAERCAAETLRLAAADARFSFDLARGPLLRTSLLRLGPAEHVLLLNTHHMVSDLWSIGVLLRELAALYGDLAAGRSPSLAPLAVQYADYAVWQRQRLQGGVLDGLLAFWRERLGGARPPLQLPADRQRPLVQSFRGADVAVRLGPEPSRAAAGLARGAGASLFMTLLGVFAGLLHRLSGETDLPVGTFVANRSQPEVEPLIGFFVNTLVLRTAVLPELPFQDLLAGVRETSLDALAHQELPFEKLLAELHPERSLSHTPLFQVMFVFQNTPGLEARLPGLELERLEVPAWRSNFDLTLWMWQGKDGLEGSLHYSSDLFDRTTARRWAGHFQTLLAAASAQPAVPLGELPLLAAAEREQVLRQWSRAAGGYRRDVRLHELFAEQAARAPAAPALVFHGSTMTYGELAAASRRLASALRAKGVGPEVRVGLLAGRDPEMVVGMLAILESGGAFLPLDPGYPPARQAALLADSRAAVLLAQERLAAASLAAAVPHLVLLDGPDGAIAPPSTPGPASVPGLASAPDAAPPPGPRVPAAALAWLIYTSGSTGRPKGVAVTHANAVPLLLWSIETFGLGPGTRVLQSLSQAFDFGVLEILSTLLAGGVLHLPGDEFGDPRRWAERAREHGVDTVHATPSFFRSVAALGVRLPEVRTLHLGGEALVRSQAERLLAAAGEGCVLYNGYGPTEVTVNSLIYAARGAGSWPAGDAVPIGRPSADGAAYVLDRAGQPVGPGVPGELLLGGPGVARCYHGRPELTAERFVPDPFGDEPGARLYRSGDLVRWLPDGNVEFLGRTDHQLKVRGFRIEPGEIEAALTRHPEVSQAVVLARDAAPGDRRLVAYVVGAAGAAPPVRELRELLAESLPAYMVPSEIVALSALPLTPTGKLDRRALPAPESGPATAGWAAPSTPAEELAAGIWEEVLGVERVGVHDNFFALGGHSLVAAQIAARLQDAFGVEVSLRAFFEAPTVAELALRIEAAGASGMPPLRRVPRGRDLPASFAQERIWFLAQLDPESAAYHVPRAVWITGRLDAAALAQAYAALLARHEILRTTFPEAPETTGRPVQRILEDPPAAWSRLPLIDLRDLPPTRRRPELERLIVADGRRRFDLARGPLLRASLARTGDEEHVVIQTEHHLVHDGWAEAVLLGDLLEIYAARTQHRPPRLPELPIQYADYACWQREWLRGEVLERQLAYWRTHLAGAPPLLELPTDRPRPAVLSARGRAHEVVLDGTLVQQLAALGRRHGATLFMTMLAGFAAVLHRWSGQPDVVVSTSIANRRRREMEGMLGMVINTLALRTDLAHDPRLRRLLARVRETCLGAYAHQDTPFHRVVDAVAAERTLSRAPLAQAHFAFHDAKFPEIDLPGLSLRPGELHNLSSKFDLTLVLRPVRERSASGPARGGMVIHHEYSSDLFDPPTMLRLIGHYRALLEGLAASAGDGPRLSELPLLTAPERCQLLWERLQAPPRETPAACLHELFAERVRRAPGAVAVTGAGETLTYGELDARANQLARHLRRLGVGPEVRVGICVEPSPLLIVGLLGILKAGGAYVPLSPSDPAERLQLILEDALAGVPAPLLLAEAGTAPHLSLAAPGALRLPPAARVLHLDSGWEAIAAEDGGPPSPGTVPSNAAYVIYTSGSTGRPKGVEIPHANVVRLFQATEPWFGFGPGDVWTLFHSAAFDFSVWEIWGALLYGGRLVVVPYAVSRSPELFRELLVRERVTVLNQTPSAFRNLSDAEEGGTKLERSEGEGERGVAGDDTPSGSVPLALRQVIFGGEALELSALAPWVARHGDASPRLVNMYGITETTVHVTWRPVSRADLRESHRSPLGVPIPDLRVHLLDGFGNLVPLGVAGEIHVGGAGLARGYLGRPELTAERFVPDPFGALAGEPGARLYRSGDLARRRPDGDLDYLGRIDSQVKIRGFRIELGEIEAALGRHPAVRRSVVVAHRRQDGLRQLVAYLVGEEEESVGVEQLRAFAGRQLPDYMVPALFVWLPELPLTPNGKVDLRSLPQPAAARLEPGEPFTPPEGAVEEALAAVWAQVLGVERVGRDDNFFALGGDSILSLRVLAEARARGIELSLQQLFLHQTVRELALAAGETRRDGARAAGDARQAGDAGDPSPRPFALLSAADRAKVPAGIVDAYPLTQLQGGLIFHSELRPETAVYHDIFSYHLGGACGVRALRRAIRRLAARHPILRTAFDLTSYGEPLQLVHRSVEMRLPVEDLRHLDPRAQERVLAAMVEAEKARPFVWSEAPLWHCRCHLRGADSYQFTITCHHAILDGWSVASLTSELFRLYLEPPGRTAAPPPASRFSRYLALEREALASEETRRFWQSAAKAGPEMRLPRWPWPASVRRSSRRESRLVRLSPRQTAALQAVAREARVPLKSVVLAAHCRVLALAHGQDEITTGLAFNGRPEEEGGDQVLGLFVNVLPLTAKPLAGSWIELARRLFEAERERLPHRRYPLAQLHKKAGGPLFETLFNFVHFHVYQDLEKLGIRRLGERFHAVNNFTFWINSVLDPWDGSLTLRLGCDPGELAGAQLRALCGWYERTLAAIGAAPWERCELSPLGEAERHQLLVEWNGSPERFEVGCLHDGFAAQAGRRPDAVAVTWQDEALSYGELARRSGRLARRLRELGVGPEVVVALCLERGPELVAAVLGVLAAGGAYVPIDPAYPAARQALVIADSGARVLLSERRLAGEAAAPLAGSRAVPVWLEDQDLSSGPWQLGRGGAGPDNLAYVIYTSGSTGSPKGVQVSHGHAVRLFAASAGWFGFGDEDVWTLFHSYAFDFSVWEIWGALLHGGRLVVVPYLVSRSPDAFHSLLRREEVTVLNQTPRAFHQLVTADAASHERLDSLRWVYLAGETLEPGSLRPWFERYGEDHPRVANGYGITETTVLNTWRLMGRRDLERGGSPIGMVFRDQTMRILDRRLQPVPVGVPGELCLGGAGITRGYLGRPELTAERFVPDPFGGEAGGRLYRSGDLARYRPDGELDYVGRLDHQVKIRGFRIELGEIEAALARHPAVRQSVVAARKRQDGLDQLVAYLVAGDAAVAEEVRAFLAQELPGHMVPELFVQLAALPLTPNGKVDRKALPEPEMDNLSLGAEYQAPAGEIEEALLEIWEDLLEVRAIGVRHDFFALGGNSLSAIQMMSRIRNRFAVELPLLGLFEAPTVAGLAALIAERRQAADTGGRTAPPRPLRAARARRPQRVPLSFAQQRLWFLQQLDWQSPIFNIPAALRLTGRLDVAALAASFDEICRRHESLRTRFLEIEAQLVQVFMPPAPRPLPLVDLGGLSSSRRQQELDRLAAREAVRLFALEREELLWRATLVRLAGEENALLFTIHHLIGDGWSLGVLANEIGVLYQAFAAGNPSPLPALALHYADYVLWQRQWLDGEQLQQQLGYWRQRLAEPLPQLELPARRRRPAVPSFAAGSVAVRIPAALAAELDDLGRRHGATTFMTLLAAFAALLHHYTGQEDLIVGTDVANRNQEELEKLIGFFVNHLALRTDLAGNPTFRELLERVREVTLGAFANQDVPLEKLIEALHPQRYERHAPLFLVMFVLHNFPQPVRQVPGLGMSFLELVPRTTPFDLTLALTRTGDGLIGSFLYARDQFDQGVISRMAEQLVALLEQVLADPDRRINSLELIEDAESRQLIGAFNDDL
jgi:amino acid adenylation domain-containing protein